MLDLENALGENRNYCRVVSYNTMCKQMYVNDSHMLVYTIQVTIYSVTVLTYVCVFCFIRSHAPPCIVLIMAKKIRPLGEVRMHNIPDHWYCIVQLGINWLLDSIIEQYNQINERVIHDVAVQVSHLIYVE